MRDRAADRPPVAHLRVADEPGGLGDDRALGPEELARLQVAVARKRADGDRVTVLTYIGEVGDAADVDEQLGTREPEAHEREERVAAREELRVLAGPEELDRVVDRLGDLVFELGRNHFAPPSWIAPQTVSGLAGISTSMTP